MERRTKLRKLTQTRVYLHHPDLPTEPCYTRDLSASGVFVHTPHAHRIRVGTVMKMTFAIDMGTLVRLYDFVVTVARVADQGLGLVIDRVRPARSRVMPRRAGRRQSAQVLTLRP